MNAVLLTLHVLHGRRSRSCTRTRYRSCSFDKKVKGSVKERYEVTKAFMKGTSVANWQGEIGGAIAWSDEVNAHQALQWM